ncbi:hypothetical protein HK101_012064 [Irineochytrium annulatum]|nr:hypothetical protein HK101_012064 [Irineochytrium annulatum]
MRTPNDLFNSLSRPLTRPSSDSSQPATDITDESPINEASQVTKAVDATLAAAVGAQDIEPAVVAVISALAWVRKGASKETPEKFALTDDEFGRIQESIQQRLDNSRDALKDAKEEEEQAALAEPDAKRSKGASSKGAKAEKMVVDDEDAAIIKEFDLDNYDDSDDDQDDEDVGMAEDDAKGAHALALRCTDVAMPGGGLFTNIKGLTYFGSNTEDPYVVRGDDEDEADELEEMMVAATDNLILAAKTEDDISHIEVYLYEEEEDNLFVHHDIMLPSFPLCIEWIGLNMGRNAGKPGKGSYVAVGTFDPEIEIWDLDVVDAMYPEAILGGSAKPGQALGTGKKKKRAKKPSLDHHVDAVMALSWNSNHPTLLASGSADTTVKLWDLTKPEKALRSFSHHSAKVQAVCWNPVESTVLLTGGYDKRACAFDTRMPDKVSAFKLTADVEVMRWDPFNPHNFYVSTEDGLVKCFDSRSKTPNTPLFTINAHDGAVSAMDVSPKVPDLIVTGSTDKVVKVWSTHESSRRCLASKDLGVGKVFSANFSLDSDLLVAVAGGKGNVVVWNLEGNPAVRKGLADAGIAGVASRPGPINKKEVTTLEEEEEEDDEEEGQSPGDDDAEMDEDGEDWEDQE